MPTPVGPAPLPHPCAECSQRYVSSEAVREHVAADHRAAPDGLGLVDALLALPEPAPGPPGPPGASATRARPRPRDAVRACTGPALLVWVLWTAGVPLEILVVGGLGVATVVTAVALHLWAEAESRRQERGSPGQP